MTDSEDGPVTLITHLTVDPENLDALLARYFKIRDEVIVNIPGHLGVTVHVSLDKSKVIVAGEWRSRADFNTILFDEEFGNLADQITELTISHDSAFYTRVNQ